MAGRHIILFAFIKGYVSQLSLEMELRQEMQNQKKICFVFYLVFCWYYVAEKVYINMIHGKQLSVHELEDDGGSGDGDEFEFSSSSVKSA